MAEHMIETRILLRYDTFSNWMNSRTILKQGEAAVAAITNEYTIEGTNHRPAHTPPAIGIKIGDGYHYFSELPWIQGVAGDVYNWAKQQTKPSYNANEITGLSTLVQQIVNDTYDGGDVTIEARMYRLQKGVGNNASNYYLQSKGANDEDWVTDDLNFIDLSQLSNVLEWIDTAMDDYWTVASFTGAKIAEKLSALNYTDNAESNKVVTAVNQVNGQISVTHGLLQAANLNGIVSVENGGTGRSTLEQDSVLVGNGQGAVNLRPIENVLTNNNNLATNKAIIRYIDDATAGLTGAMHYVGEATVTITNGSATNPRIDDYNFSAAQPGDVITFNYQEFIWNGVWRLLGDEGSYAIKGSIVDRDISDEAAINQNKIANLINDLLSKVDKEEGKTLTSNDFTDEYKNKLDGIEENAQQNIIEHVYVNGTEAIPTTVDGKPNSLSLRVSALTPEEEEKISGIEANAQVNKIEHIFLNEEELNIGTIKNLPKSVHLQLTEFTEDEKTKLSEIEAGAQVNTIEKITINGTEYTPDDYKRVSITLDQAALNLNVLEGAQYPLDSSTNEDVPVTNKKLQLARVAATGNVSHLLQTADTYIILNCGSSTEVI